MKNKNVSIAMITYNHELYIRQAIEGVLMQETSFPIEFVIGEDFSTDKTRNICEEYATRFPDKIKLLPTEGNLGMMPNFIRTLKACRGKYIALCEGDDYWTDPLKLQKQVDFLEGNEDFSICHHPLKVIYQDENKASHISNPEDHQVERTIFDLVENNFIYTASCVFRNNPKEILPEAVLISPVGDYILHMFNAQFGKIKYIPEIMGVYRVHKGGIWEITSNIEKSQNWILVIEALKTFIRDDVKYKLIQKQNQILVHLIKNDYGFNYEKLSFYNKLLIENDVLYLKQLLNEKEEAIIKLKRYANFFPVKLLVKLKKFVHN